MKQENMPKADFVVSILLMCFGCGFHTAYVLRRMGCDSFLPNAEI
jgi:hypothetical protein